MFLLVLLWLLLLSSSYIRGAGIAQWLERRTRDWKVAGSNPCWGGGRIFFSRVNFLCWLLFRYPFHPRVTAVARKRPRSFCQKCGWQFTTKYACTLRMWLCMKWHGAWLYGVHRTRRDGSSFMWHQPCQCCTPLRWIVRNALRKAFHLCRITCERSESARELYKSDQQQQPANKNTKLKNHKLTQSEARAKPELQAVAVGILRMCATFCVGISDSFENIM